MRERSAWESSTLSYSGRKRGGAGVSGSGRGASGRSNSSRRARRGTSAGAGRSRRRPRRSRVSPDQACDVARPWPARRRRGSAGPCSSSAAGGSSGAPSQASTVVQRGLARSRPTRRAAGPAPAAPVARRRRRARRVARPGQRSASSRPSAARVRGRSSSSSRPAASSASTSMPASRRGERAAANCALQHRLHDRAQRQAVARGDEVDRRAHQRDAHRPPLLDQPRELVGSKPSSRVQSPTYGASGACACMPTRCSIASAAELPARSRASAARAGRG